MAVISEFTFRCPPRLITVEDVHLRMAMNNCELGFCNIAEINIQLLIEHFKEKPKYFFKL